MSALGTAKSFVDTVRERNVTLLAAGVTYYAFASVVPLLILALAVASTFGGRALIGAALRRVAAVSPVMASLLRDALATQTGRIGASVVGTLVLLWSAIRVFRGIDTAFGEIYGAEDDDDLLGEVKNALVVVVAIAAAAVLIAAVAAATRLLPEWGVPFPRVLSTLVLLGGLAALLFPIYYVMPPFDASVDHALPGTVVAAVGWVVLQWGFVYYTGHAARYAAYGVLGGVLLFVTWLYAASIVLLAGAVLNVVLDYPGGSLPSAEVVTSD